MGDESYSIGVEIDQWSTLLLSSVFLSINANSDNIELIAQANEKNCSNIKDIRMKLNDSMRLLKKYSKEDINNMFSASQRTIIELNGNSQFHSIFSQLVQLSHGILGISYNIDATKGKIKVLHTESLVAETQLTENDEIKCNVLVFLATILEKAICVPVVKLGLIDVSTIEMLFGFLDHQQPNSVRSNAGKILSALSASPVQLSYISDFFWKRFDGCKKDEDFRNFASWIDGIVDLRFCYISQSMSEMTNKFFMMFITNAKRMERGVLRMKILEALISIFDRVSKDPNSKTNSDFNLIIRSIWAQVMKWSSKSKHTVFCYEFLCKMLFLFDVTFFSDVGLGFGENLVKALKAGPTEIIKLIGIYVSNLPMEYTMNRVDDFSKYIQMQIIPSLFSGNEKKRCLKYNDLIQQQGITEIFVSIGIKNIFFFIDFFRSVYSVDKPTEDHRLVRLIVLKALANIIEKKPDIVSTFNVQLFPYIESILMLNYPGLPEEIEYAIKTFPIIHPQDETKMNLIVTNLFVSVLDPRDQSANIAMNSILAYIHHHITISNYPLLPMTFIDQVCENLLSMNNSMIEYRLNILKSLLNEVLCCFGSHDSITALRNGESQMKSSNWTSMRNKIDKIIVILLIIGEKSISNHIYQLVELLRDNGIKAIDMAFNRNFSYYVPNWIGDMKDSLNLHSYSKLLISNNPALAQVLFLFVFDFWINRRSSFNIETDKKFISFIASMSQPNENGLNLFFSYVLKEHKSNARFDIASVICNLKSPLWITFLTFYEKWMAEHELPLSSFWIQTTNLLFCFLSHPDFSLQISDDQDLELLFERFMTQVFNQILESRFDPSYNIIYEKSLKIFRVLLEQKNFNLLRFIDMFASSYVRFIRFFYIFVSQPEKINGSSSYYESFFGVLITLFSNYVIPKNTDFEFFFEWVFDFIKDHYSNELLILLFTRLMTELLNNNPLLIKSYFSFSCSCDSFRNSQIILSVSNCIQKRNKHICENTDLLLFVYAIVIVHIQNDNLIERQASLTLFAHLMLLNDRELSLTAVNVSKVLTSETPFGYRKQGSDISILISSLIPTSLVYPVFQLFSSCFNTLTSCQEYIIITLKLLIPILLQSVPIETSTTVVLILSSNYQYNDTASSKAIRMFWIEFMQTAIEKCSEFPLILLGILKLFCLGLPSMKSQEFSSMIYIFEYIFDLFPSYTMDLLLSSMKKYDIKLPNDYVEFSKFISKGTLNFVVNKEDILFSNAISYILMTMNNNDCFHEYIAPYLPLLFYFSTLMYHVEEMQIGKFQPLFVSLIDASLVRFGSQEVVSIFKKLCELNFFNHIYGDRLSYSLEDDSSKLIIFYDRQTISSLTNTFESQYSGFSNKLFDIIFNCALSVSVSDREMDPFLFMLGLNDFLSTQKMIQLLLFLLVSIKTSRLQLIDYLIDNLHQRLVSTKISVSEFNQECIPSVLLLINCLYLRIRDSFSVHIMKLIKSLCSLMCLKESAFLLSKTMFDLINAMKGDLFISSLFSKFIEGIKSFSDPIVVLVIETLEEISNLLSISQSKQNWCHLYAILIDGFRYFIHKKSSLAIKTIIIYDESVICSIDSFINYICTLFPDIKYHQFMVEFLCSLNKDNSLVESNVDLISTIMINTIILKSSNVFDSNFTEKLQKHLSVISFSLPKDGKINAAIGMSKLLDSQDSENYCFNIIDDQIKFSYRKLKEIGCYTFYDKLKIDQNCLPSIKPFETDDTSVTLFLSSLWSFIFSIQDQKIKRSIIPSFFDIVKEEPTEKDVMWTEDLINAHGLLRSTYFQFLDLPPIDDFSDSTISLDYSYNSNQNQSKTVSVSEFNLGGDSESDIDLSDHE